MYHTAQKLSFVVLEQLNEIVSLYEQDKQTHLLCDSLADMPLDNRHLVQELISIFPDVENNLDASGKLQDWGKALKMIKDNHLPQNNIAHVIELFSDVVQWSDLDHHRMMRYRPKVKQFWSIGYNTASRRTHDRTISCNDHANQYFFNKLQLNSQLHMMKYMHF